LLLIALVFSVLAVVQAISTIMKARDENQILKRKLRDFERKYPSKTVHKKQKSLN
jgi:hypothetical protein